MCNSTKLCKFCKETMSSETFEMVTQYTCRNRECRAYAITLTWAAWGAMTPEKLETYPQQFAHENTEEVTRPEHGAVIFEVERMGSKLVLWVTGDVKETSHTVYGQADIDKYAAIYKAQGYAVQMAVQS